MNLPILYQDDVLIAVNKPTGLLVHRSEIDRHETRFALQLVRDQIGQRVYPIHRLDKPTSGVLLFALDPNTARRLSESFAKRETTKSYIAVCRGYAPQSVYVDYALKEELDKYTDKKARRDRPPQEAQTQFSRLATFELDVEIESYPQSRYSLIECRPETGRKHQIRRHLKHISHPIIGDAKHGRGRHNRYFKHQLGVDRLLLHSGRLQIDHPANGEPLELVAPLDDTFMRLVRQFGWENALPSYIADSIASAFVED